jgi:hypothetical protein
MQSTEVLSGAGLAAAAGSAQNATAGAMVATIASAAGRTAYITGFDVTGTGATSGVGINVTITGLATAAGTTLNYGLQIPAGVTVAMTGGGLFVKFDKPLPASAANTNILVSVPSFGSGNTECAVNAYGFLSNP